MDYLKTVKERLNEAVKKGDIKQEDSLKVILASLITNANHPSPKPEREVLEKLYEELEKTFKSYEDYVTPDHAKARSNYKNDLGVLEKLLREG